MDRIKVIMSDYEYFDLYVKAGDFKVGGTVFVCDKEEYEWYHCKIKIITSYYMKYDRDHFNDDIGDEFYNLVNSCGYSGEFILDDICHYICTDEGVKLDGAPNLDIIGYC